MSMVHIRYKSALVVFSVLCAGAFAFPAQGASFDCAKASTKVEHMICDNPELSKLDQDLNISYQRALKRSKNPLLTKEEQQVWLRTRDTCRDADCVQLAYQARLFALKHGGYIGWIPDTFWLTEEQKAAEARKVLEESSVKLRPGSYENDSAHFHFCTTFLDNFEHNRGMEYIEPKFRTTDYNDPALTQVRDQCPKVHWAWSAPKRCDADALASWLKGFEGDKAGALRKAHEICDTLFGLNEVALYEANVAGHRQYVIYQSRTPNIDTARLESLLRTPTKKELWTDQSALNRKMNTVVNVFFALSGYSVINVSDDGCEAGANLGTLGFTSPESHQGIVRYESQYIAYNLIRSSKHENKLTFIVGGHNRVCYFDLNHRESVNSEVSK